MPKKSKKTKAEVVKPERIEKAELFAYAYIRNMGNGRAAAAEVYGLEDEAARSQASRLLTNANVQKIIGEFLDAQRESLKKFSEQGNFYLTIVSQKLIEIIQSPNTSVSQCFEAMERLMRLGGFEISESVTVAKIEAKAGGGQGRALIPGVPAPGVQPGAPGTTVNNDNRKSIFMLMPPPMPPGGVPPPALEQQWRDQGWKPGIAPPAASAENPGHGVVPVARRK